MPTSVSNYNFLVPLVTEIWRGSQNKTGSADLLRRPLADQFLHVAIVPAYAYQRTKFHLSRSIIFGDIRGGGKIKCGSSWFPQTPPGGQIFIQGASARKCLQVCQISTPGSISYPDTEGVLKFNVGALAPCRTPYAENFMCAQSTWQGQTACQISASYLYASFSYANMYFP